MGDFKLMKAKVIQQPEQYVVLQFSDPLDQDQNLNGIISIESQSRARFIIEDNEVRVYPRKRLKGEHKIEISGGLKNILGYKFDKQITNTLAFEDIKPAVRFVGSGTILPSSDGLVFPFEAVNLWAVDVRIIKVYENNVGQFLQVNQLDGNREMKRVGRLLTKKAIRLRDNSDGVVDLGSWNRFYLNLEELIQTDPGAIYRVELGFQKELQHLPLRRRRQ